MDEPAIHSDHLLEDRSGGRGLHAPEKGSVGLKGLKGTSALEAS